MHPEKSPVWAVLAFYKEIYMKIKHLSKAPKLKLWESSACPCFFPWRGTNWDVSEELTCSVSCPAPFLFLTPAAPGPGLKAWSTESHTDSPVPPQAHVSLRDMVCALFVSLWSLKAWQTSRSHKTDTPLLLPDFLRLETSARLTGTHLYVQRRSGGVPLPLVGWQESKHGDFCLMPTEMLAESPSGTGPSPGFTAVKPHSVRTNVFF